jgi:hypothetical protein
VSSMINERMAKCGCGSVRPSKDREVLAFFEDLSDEALAGKPVALLSCGTCGMNEGVHHEVNVFTGGWGITDHDFVRRVYEFDRFYCGCRGWD